MAYCNWCNLESESDDFCVWCKRPLGKSGVYRQSRSDLHYLRHTDDDHQDGPLPVFAIIGAICFLAIVLIAIFTFKPHQAETVDTTHLTLDDQAPEGAGPVGGAPPVTGGAGGGSSVPTPTAPPPILVGSSVQPPANGSRAGSSTQGSTPSTQTGGGLAVSNGVQNLPGGGSVAPAFGAGNTLYFESVDLAIKPDASGVKRLVGDIVVQNDTGANLARGALTLYIASTKYPLYRFDGSVEKPRFLPSFAISAKSGMTCHVLARDLDASSIPPGDRYLLLEGVQNGKPIAPLKAHLTQQVHKDLVAYN